MWDLARRTAAVLGTVVFFLAAAAFAYTARWVLVVFLFAIFFADLLNPIVVRVQLWTKVSRGSRTIAILEVYAVAGIILVLLGFLVGPRIEDEVRRLGAALPTLLEKVNSGQIVHQLGEKHGWSYKTQMHLQTLLSHHRGFVLSLENDLGEYIAAFARNAVWFVLIPILAFFFLRDGKTFADEIITMIERRGPRRILRKILEDLNQMVSHYIRAQLTLAALALAVYTLVFWLMRLPYSFALSSIAGILEFIPVVGPLIAAVVVLGVSFLENYTHVLLILLFLGIWRIVQDYVITPHIMKNNLEMHPLAIIFAVLVGAEIWGVIGVYLSIPVMASVRIFWRSWRHYAELHAASRPSS
jgi:predicted PurR-regulated permease PerM